jgi:hypothetical protein
MLANELLGFIRRQYTGSMDVSADSAGDDVYTWSVEMWKSAFKPDCQLAKVCAVQCDDEFLCVIHHHAEVMKVESCLLYGDLGVECCVGMLCWKLLPDQHRVLVSATGIPAMWAVSSIQLHMRRSFV